MVYAFSRALDVQSVVHCWLLTPILRILPPCTSACCAPCSSGARELNPNQWHAHKEDILLCFLQDQRLAATIGSGPEYGVASARPFSGKIWTQHCSDVQSCLGLSVYRDCPDIHVYRIANIHASHIKKHMQLMGKK